MRDLAAFDAYLKSAARVRWINKCDLVIIDEVRYLPVSKTEANLFFGLISQFYESASVVITSNKGFEGWGSFLATLYLLQLCWTD
ncbi:MAG: ATP-binding protein [Ruminiclostridium sp.]|nr:ATP-binding protein [Ruminiclostridium sp.]